MRLPFTSLQTNAELVPLSNFIEKRDAEVGSHLLKLLSYNIQVGIASKRYSHYVTKSWQHLLPNRARARNLAEIAELIKHFDLIALQEVDGGSFRTGFMNQVHYLAHAAGKAFWHQQLNRNLGQVGQHSNAVISDLHPTDIQNHTLPGFKGRGAIAFELPDAELVIIVTHLALTKQSQNLQLSYIKSILDRYPNGIVMGDFNTDSQHLLHDSPLADCNLKTVQKQPTYPSWQPTKCLDHILVSDSIVVHRVGVVDFKLSDHLPVALEIEYPKKSGDQ